MSLITTLTGDMKAAMKARETARLSTIRLLLSGLKNEEIKKRQELTESEEIDFLAREAKRRRESIEAFGQAGRDDLVAGERDELAVIEAYLPQPLSEGEVREMIRDTIAATGAASKRDMGKVMGSLMPSLRGRFDGKAVKALVLEALP